MKSTVMGFIAVLLVAGFFAVLASMLYAAFVLKTPLDGTLKDVLLVMLGTLGSMVGMVVSYYFGSSKSSADKNELLMAK